MGLASAMVVASGRWSRKPTSGVLVAGVGRALTLTLLASLLGAPVAHAAAPGATSTRLTTKSGQVFEGTIVDRLPNGYLMLLANGATAIVPYLEVNDIQGLPQPTPPAAQPAAFTSPAVAPSVASAPLAYAEPPAATVSSAPGVPVQFRAPHGGTFSVTVNGAAGGSCRLPCTLQLPPGPASVRISGDMDMTKSLTIPDGPASVAITKGNSGLHGVGITLVTIGSIGGIFLMATDKSGEDISTAEAQGRLEIAVLDLALVGIGGLMMLSARASSVEVSRGSFSARPVPPGGLRLAAVGAAPLADGGMVGVRFAF